MDIHSVFGLGVPYCRGE